MESSKKIFLILELLAIKGEASITEISKNLVFGISLVHRLLSILKDLGYVGQDGQNKKYYASLKLLEIGSLVRGRINLIQIARPFMESFKNVINETMLLAFLDGGEVVYIDSVTSGNTLNIDLSPGMRVPAYATALGKILLADLPQEILEQVLLSLKFKKFTSKTVRSARELKIELVKVKEEGFAIDAGEIDDSVRPRLLEMKMVSWLPPLL
jgi:IclR family acetate operon transcriptional repressor